MLLPPAIDIVKVLLIGCGGALAYYVVLSYVFQLAIYPVYLKAADFLIQAAVQPEARTKTERYLNTLRFLRGVLGVLMGLTWWLLFAGFVYVLYLLLAYYFSPTLPYFWGMLGAAVVLPALWALWRFIGFFRQDPETPAPLPMDTRPLWEQMLDEG